MEYLLTRMDPQGSEHRRCYCVHGLARDSGISKDAFSKTSFWTTFWSITSRENAQNFFFAQKSTFWSLFFSYLTENSKKVSVHFFGKDFQKVNFLINFRKILYRGTKTRFFSKSEKSENALKTSLFLITFQTSRVSNTLWSPGQSPLVWTRIWPILSRICQARLWTRDLGQATSGQGSGPSHKDLGSSRL